MTPSSSSDNVNGLRKAFSQLQQGGVLKPIVAFLMSYFSPISPYLQASPIFISFVIYTTGQICIEQCNVE